MDDQAAAIQCGLWLRCELPDQRWRQPHLAERERHLDERIEIAATGLEQQHTDVAVFGQSRRETAPAEPAPTMT